MQKSIFKKLAQECLHASVHQLYTKTYPEIMSAQQYHYQWTHRVMSNTLCSSFKLMDSCGASSGAALLWLTQHTALDPTREQDGKRRERNSTSVASPDPSDFSSLPPSSLVSPSCSSFRTLAHTTQSPLFHTNTRQSAGSLWQRASLSASLSAYNPEGARHQRLPGGLHADTSDE